MKGQTAIEYLMTYGWAILIILIVAGVLAYYGIFAPSGFLAPTARGFGNLGISSPWIVTTAGNITLQVQNKVGQTISITNIYAGQAGAAKTQSCTVSPVVQITSGSTAIVTCTTMTTPITGTSGSSYSLDISLQYTVISNGLVANESGTISGKY